MLDLVSTAGAMIVGGVGVGLALLAAEQRQVESNLPEPLQALLRAAHAHAGRLHHEHVGTEHLLLALLERSPMPALGLDWARVSACLQEHLLPGPELLTLGRLPLTPKAREALCAAQDARGAGMNLELLAALIDQRDLAAEALRAGGVTAESVRRALADLD